MLSWDMLRSLVRIVPHSLDRDEKKGYVSKKLRRSVLERDGYVCKVCRGRKTLIAHHIIPNGPACMTNLIILCGKCHRGIHWLLFISEKWRYVKMW